MAVAVFGSAAALLVWHPKTPLPKAWNPIHPLDITAPLTALTGWKLNRTAADAALCVAALEREQIVSLSPLLSENPRCGIKARVRVSGVGTAVLDPVDTSCAVALRLAMWERHGLQPAAQAAFGTSIARIEHQSSYVCREIRTPDGSGGRMSTHATGEAIDVKGFVLKDGRRVSLLADWVGNDAEATFLRRARDTSCTWFATTLGPEYNALHAAHFHLQSRGWGLCR